MLYRIPLDVVMAKLPDSANTKKVLTTIGNKQRNAQLIKKRDGN